MIKDKKATLAFGMQIGETGDAYHWYPLYTADGGYIFGTNADGSYNPQDMGSADRGRSPPPSSLCHWRTDGVSRPR